MDVLFLIVLSAAFTAGFIMLLRWAVTEDRKTSLRERFDQVVSHWGKEE